MQENIYHQQVSDQQNIQRMSQQQKYLRQQKQQLTKQRSQEQYNQYQNFNSHHSPNHYRQLNNQHPVSLPPPHPNSHLSFNSERPQVLYTSNSLSHSPMRNKIFNYNFSSPLQANPTTQLNNNNFKNYKSQLYSSINLHSYNKSNSYANLQPYNFINNYSKSTRSNQINIISRRGVDGLLFCNNKSQNLIQRNQQSSRNQGLQQNNSTGQCCPKLKKNTERISEMIQMMDNHKRQQKAQALQVQKLLQQEFKTHLSKNLEEEQIVNQRVMTNYESLKQFYSGDFDQNKDEFGKTKQQEENQVTQQQSPEKVFSRSQNKIPILKNGDRQRRNANDLKYIGSKRKIQKIFEENSSSNNSCIHYNENYSQQQQVLLPLSNSIALNLPTSPYRKSFGSKIGTPSSGSPKSLYHMKSRGVVESRVGIGRYVDEN